MERALIMAFRIDEDIVEGMSDDEILNEAYAYCYIQGAMIAQSDIYFEE